MKVLYCNPVFFEYRLPFYKELVRLFDGNFFVMYSPVRFKICKKEKFCQQVKEELGDNAIPLSTDHVFDTYSKRLDQMPDIEKGKRLPLTFGLIRAIRKFRPDVLITEGYFQWTPLVLLYGIIYRVPIYMGYERTLHTERNTGKLKTFQRKLFYIFFAGFIVNGNETKKYLLSLGVDEKKIHIGGMSADSEGLQKGIALMSDEEKKTLRKRFVGEQGLAFLFSGNITERKGIDLLLEAWRIHIVTHSDDHLIIIGHGDLSDALEAEYKNFSSVHFLGQIPYTTVYQYYAIADVFILPTIEDNWSLVIPEAMACGLPVATSIYNGCHSELIKKITETELGNGCTFDTFDQQSLIDALSFFHRKELKAMGEKSIEIEKLYNTSNCTRRVYEILSNKSTI